MPQSFDELWAMEQRRLRVLLTGRTTMHKLKTQTYGGKQPWRNLGEFLAAVVNADIHKNYDERLAASGMNTGTGMDGGHAVQEDFIRQLVDRAMYEAQLAPRCTTIPVTSNKIAAPFVDETSRANGSRWGGLQVARTLEGTEIATSKAKLGQARKELPKLAAGVVVTDEMLEDLPTFGQFVERGFGEEFAWIIDNEILNGSGAGECLGINKSAAVITVSKETGQLADTIVEENIRAMWNRLPARSRARAVWLVGEDAEGQLLGIQSGVGASGLITFGNSEDGPRMFCLGRPVLTCEQCATVGDKGDLVLADLGEYVLFDRGLATVLSAHARFVNGETIIRFTHRIDGQPLPRKAKTPAAGTATLSPFVVLETRA